MNKPKKKLHSRPYIIAEIGFNHEGNIELAKRMIKAAAESGADAVKFQTYRASDLALPSSPHFKAIKTGEINLQQHMELYNTARSCEIDFLSTPYSFWAVDLLEKVGVKAYKIASMDLTNTELLQYVAKTGKKMFISTGMAAPDEIRSAVRLLQKSRSGPITLLHCLSRYPANPFDINLAFMKRMKETCHCAVGYSDHTKGTIACLTAAVLGADVIEKHFTLDTSKPGADHYHSADPEQLEQLIEDINFSISMIGSEDEFRDRVDRQDSRILRRGVYACMNISKGSKILREHVVCCRPETEYSPQDLEKIIGKTARRYIQKNSPITKKDI